jgi:thioredoxin 1
MKKLFGLIFVAFLLFGCDNKDIATQKETQKSFFEVLKAEKIGKEPIVLEIGSSSCKTCVDMKKIIDDLKSRNTTLPIHIIDVYDDMNAFKHFNIQMIPTQVVLNAKGEEVYRHIGGLSGEEMLRLVELSRKQ